MKIQITSAYILPGFVYEIAGEDGQYTTSSFQVGATTVNGEKLFHSTFVALGHGVDEEGFNCVNYAAAQQAKRFADKVSSSGWINPAHWEKLPEAAPLEERLHDEFLREYRDGERW